MACEYCTGDKYLIERDKTTMSLKRDTYPGIEICIDGGVLSINYIADAYEANFTEEEIPINFCPVCGDRVRNIDEQGIASDEHFGTKNPLIKKIVDWRANKVHCIDCVHFIRTLEYGICMLSPIDIKMKHIFHTCDKGELKGL